MESTKNHSNTRAHKAVGAFTHGTAGERGFFRDPGQQQRWQLICAYLRVLDRTNGPIAVESDLPCPKELIAEAILQELADDPDSDLRRRLEIAYIQLESFIPYRDYRIIEDFKEASQRAQRLADMGDPTSIIRSVRMMRQARGDSAIRLEEKIHERMNARSLQLQKLRECCA